MHKKTNEQENRLSLKDFVKNTLVDINEAVNEAIQEGVPVTFHPDLNNNLLPSSQNVSFDLSVTTEAVDAKKGAAGLQISVINGNIGKQSQVSEQSVNRIKFDVSLFLGQKIKNKRN